MPTPSTCLSFDCELCQIVQFDDSQYEGFASDFTGKPTLDFVDPLPRHKPAYSPNDNYLREPTVHLKLTCGAWDDDSLPHLPHLKALEEKGCEFARLLRDAILGSRIDFEGRVHLDFMYDWRNGGKNNNWGLNALAVMIGLIMTKEEANESKEDFDVMKKYGDDGSVAMWNYYLQFSIESGEGNCAQWLDIEPSPAHEALCDENVENLRRNIENCLSNCHPPQASKFVPTRLLDLGTSSMDMVRLIETVDFADMPSYVALTYCWGPPDQSRTQLKTERNTLGDRKNGIPHEIMSRVMQDAIYTTRMLSYRYLWIDALCIIQDDKLDWERESASMGQVYNNAILTLCALSSSSCHEGFLKRSETPLSVPFRSKINPSISGSYRLRPYPVEKDRSRGFLFSSDEINRAQSSWRTRAWTFQEYELSTRVIYFGKSRLHFACPERTCVEGHLPRENPKYLQPFVHQIRDYEAKIIDRDRLYTLWFRLLERYGDRQCTFPGDKLPAISGIAKLMADSLGDTYIAGLWSGALAPGLLWSTTENPECFGLDQHIQACKKSHIPSWTWVNQTQRFKHGHSCFWIDNDDELASECSALNAKSDLSEVTLNPFGKATNAVLSVTSRTFQLTASLQRVHVAQDRQTWKVDWESSVTAWVELDYTVHHTLRTLNVDLKMVLIASAIGMELPFQDIERIAARMEGGEEGESQGSISSDGSDADFDSDSEEESRHAWGLLLHPSGRADEFYRVGIFTTRGKQGGGMAFFEDCEKECLSII